MSRQVVPVVRGSSTMIVTPTATATAQMIGLRTHITWRARRRGRSGSPAGAPASATSSARTDTVFPQAAGRVLVSDGVTAVDAAAPMQIWKPADCQYARFTPRRTLTTPPQRAVDPAEPVRLSAGLATGTARLIRIWAGFREVHPRTTGRPLRWTPAERSWSIAWVVLSAATPAVRSSNTRVWKPSLTASSAVCRTQ